MDRKIVLELHCGKLTPVVTAEGRDVFLDILTAKREIAISFPRATALRLAKAILREIDDTDDESKDS